MKMKLNFFLQFKVYNVDNDGDGDRAFYKKHCDSSPAWTKSCRVKSSPVQKSKESISSKYSFSSSFRQKFCVYIKQNQLLQQVSLSLLHKSEKMKEGKKWNRNNNKSTSKNNNTNRRNSFTHPQFVWQLLLPFFLPFLRLAFEFRACIHVYMVGYLRIFSRVKKGKLCCLLGMKMKTRTIIILIMIIALDTQNVRGFRGWNQGRLSYRIHSECQKHIESRRRDVNEKLFLSRVAMTKWTALLARDKSSLSFSSSRTISNFHSIPFNSALLYEQHKTT